METFWEAIRDGLFLLLKVAVVLLVVDIFLRYAGYEFRIPFIQNFVEWCAAFF